MSQLPVAKVNHPEFPFYHYDLVNATVFIYFVTERYYQINFTNTLQELYKIVRFI